MGRTTNTTEAKDYAKAPFIAVSAGYYGKGFTTDEAVANMRREGGKVTVHYVYQLPEGATNGSVDNWGGVTWEWADEETAERQYGVVGTYVAARGIPALKDRVVPVREG